MATRRDIEVALILLRGAGYPDTGQVRPEHHRLVDSDRALDGTLTEWLQALPAPKLEGLLDRLATRGTEPRSILDAERLLAALDVLLPGETLVNEARLRAVHSPAYAVHLQALAADLAARTFGFLQTRHGAGLAPVKLLDVGFRAVRMLEEHQVPDVQADPFTQPSIRALRTAVSWMTVRHGLDTATERLHNALTAANW